MYADQLRVFLVEHGFQSFKTRCALRRAGVRTLLVFWQRETAPIKFIPQVSFELKSHASTYILWALQNCLYAASKSESKICHPWQMRHVFQFVTQSLLLAPRYVISSLFSPRWCAGTSQPSHLLLHRPQGIRIARTIASEYSSNTISNTKLRLSFASVYARRCSAIKKGNHSNTSTRNQQSFACNSDRNKKTGLAMTNRTKASRILI